MHLEEIKIFIYPDGRLDSLNAAIYLGINRTTLGLLRIKGKGPKYIKRGRIFYYRDDLDHWLLGNGKQSCSNSKND